MGKQKSPAKYAAQSNSTFHAQITIYLYMTLGFQPPLKQRGVNITTIACLRVLIIEIGSTIILMVVEAQGMICTHMICMHLLAYKKPYILR